MQKRAEHTTNGIKNACTIVLWGTVIALALGVGTAGAAYDNPFTETPVVRLSETEKKRIWPRRPE